MTPGEIVDAVLAEGRLIGLANPYGGLIARIRKLPENLALSRQFTDGEIERARWHAIGNAARRGETLAALVNSEDVFADEAEQVIASEYADEELRAIALDALRGRVR
jgi:hypothetical protein